MTDLGVGRRVFKTSDPTSDRAALDAIEQTPHQVRIDVNVSARIGERFTLEATTERGATGSSPRSAIERTRPA